MVSVADKLGELLTRLNACTGLTFSPNSSLHTIVAGINTFILDNHVRKWSERAGRPLGPPETTPGPCIGHDCVNFAIVYPRCTECCRRLYKVDVGTSTISGAGLGLFAAKTFKSGDYVCDYSYEMTKSSNLEGTKMGYYWDTS